MKNILKLRFTFAVIITAFFAGCAGISDANSPDEAHSLDTETEEQAIHQEIIDFVNGGDQEDIIEVRPGSSYDDRKNN